MGVRWASKGQLEKGGKNIPEEEGAEAKATTCGCEGCVATAVGHSEVAWKEMKMDK